MPQLVLEHGRGDDDAFLGAGRAAGELKEQRLRRSVRADPGGMFVPPFTLEGKDDPLLVRVAAGDRAGPDPVGQARIKGLGEAGERQELGRRQIAELVKEIAVVFASVDARRRPGQDGRQAAGQHEPDVKQKQLDRVRQEEQHHASLRHIR